MNGETVRENRRMVELAALTFIREMEWVTEASRLGWAPGVWPTEIVVKMEDGTEVELFRWASPMVNRETEPTGFIYQAKTGGLRRTTVIVYND